MQNLDQQQLNRICSMQFPKIELTVQITIIPSEVVSWPSQVKFHNWVDCNWRGPHHTLCLSLHKQLTFQHKYTRKHKQIGNRAEKWKKWSFVLKIPAFLFIAFNICAQPEALSLPGNTNSIQSNWLDDIHQAVQAQIASYTTSVTNRLVLMSLHEIHYTITQIEPLGHASRASSWALTYFHLPHFWYKHKMLTWSISWDMTTSKLSLFWLLYHTSPPQLTKKTQAISIMIQCHHFLQNSLPLHLCTCKILLGTVVTASNLMYVWKRYMGLMVTTEIGWLHLCGNIWGINFVKDTWFVLLSSPLGPDHTIQWCRMGCRFAEGI
jgi:hypothetical protein